MNATQQGQTVMAGEHRRSQRKRAHHMIHVTDAITGQLVGHVGNLSIDGMLLISNRQLPEDALFQFVDGAGERGDEMRDHGCRF